MKRFTWSVTIVLAVTAACGDDGLARRQAEVAQAGQNVMPFDLGAQIRYFSDDSVLVQAIHQWFDAQLVDHGAHAQSHR